MTTAIWIAGAILLIANIAVTARLLLNNTYLVSQKIAQIAIIWFLPFLGALVVWHFLREENEKPTKESSEPTEDIGDIGWGNRDGHSRHRNESESTREEYGVDGGSDAGSGDSA